MWELQVETWHDFYLTIGAGAAAILGATFIVATLTANVRERVVGLRGFITPTAVHLASILVASVIMTMPVLKFAEYIVVFGVGGLAGMIYGVIVFRRIQAIKIDVPDNLWYGLIPIIGYGGLAVSAVLLWRDDDTCFELQGIALTVLLIAGLRNAWDMATFLILRDDQKPPVS
jgi:hypothetical protein